jgi:hypothetical protein
MADISYPELQKLVAQKLQLIADSEPLNAGYASKIQQRCVSVQEQLDTLDVVSVDVENGIEEALADAFADLVAAECADVFQLPEPRRSMLVAQKIGMPGRSVYERRIRNLLTTSKLTVSTDVTYV